MQRRTELYVQNGQAVRHILGLSQCAASRQVIRRPSPCTPVARETGIAVAPPCGIGQPHCLLLRRGAPSSHSAPIVQSPQVASERQRLGARVEDNAAMEPPAGDLAQRFEAFEVAGTERGRRLHLDAHDPPNFCLHHQIHFAARDRRVQQLGAGSLTSCCQSLGRLRAAARQRQAPPPAALSRVLRYGRAVLSGSTRAAF